MEIKLREMNRKQMKELRKAGFDLALFGNETDGVKTAGMVDWILDNIYSDVKDLDERPYHELVKMAGDTYKLSYGGTEAIKN